MHLTDLEKPIHSAQMLELMQQLEGTDISLDRDTLLTLARESLDVDIDIDEQILNRFSDLFEEVTSNGPVHKAGYLFMQQTAVNAIVQNSRMSWIRRNDPDIARRPVTKPLVITGLPRSGTTHLMQLLASEPTLVTLKRWEAQRSFPSKSVVLGNAQDRREEEGVEILQKIEDMLPYRRYMYDVEADQSSEEIEIMLNGCFGPLPSFFGDTPAHDDFIFNSDQTQAYQYLYKYIQTLSAFKGMSDGQRWLLKTPQHMANLVALDRVFPDAAVVFSHRDPASVFASLLTLMGYSVRQFYDRSSKQQLIARVKRQMHGLLRGVVANAERFSDRSVHIYFHELMQDYHQSVEKIYTVAGIPYDEAAQTRVAKQAELNTRGRQGARLVYKLEADYGISRDDIREEFSYYLDKFPVQIEESHL